MRIHLLAIVAACSVAGSVAAQDYTRYTGSWSGPFLIYVADQDSGAQGPSVVYPGKLRIDDDGSLRGGIPDIACSFTGSSSDFVSPVNASIDLMASGCSDTRYNGRYLGKLIENPPLRYASLRLSSMRSLDTGVVQMSAILRH